ncbi:MAG TPA: hypothetical protein VF017_13130 [Thermoanaerobaculia bacterium]|nr:hypothetical protein [Thermoanaerobaculia bacterium]
MAIQLRFSLRAVNGLAPALALGLALQALPAGACEKAGQPFVLTLDRQTRLGDPAANTLYAVGETPIYTVRCAAPFAPIYWSSDRNGASTGEVNAFYGHYTDANGFWTSPGGPWLASHRGVWQKRAQVGGQTAGVNFTVTSRLTMNNSIDGGPLYAVGETPTYTIANGPPSAPIYWSSTRNGVSTGEVNAFYGHYTDVNGSWTSPGGPWQSSHVGTWTKTAVIGNPADPYVDRSSFGFQVIPSCEIFPPVTTSTAWSDFASRAGAYVWTNRCLLDDGVNKLSAIGGHTVRLLLSPRCSPPESLVSLLYSSEVWEALSDPNIWTYELTTFDQSGCQAKAYVDPTLYTPAFTASVVAEYRDFAYNLAWLSHWTGKQFIISNWEGDNVVYCSASYGYATDPATRAVCDANFPIWYRGVPNPTTALQGFKTWLLARQQGIAEGNQLAWNDGLWGWVAYSVELNIVRALQQNGFQSVLYNVVPQVPADYVNYSAYESTNVSAGQLLADLTTIRNVSGNPNVIIGEFGYSQKQWSRPDYLQRTHDVFNTAFGWGVPYAYTWVIFDGEDFGLYNLAGVRQPMGCYFEQRFAGTANPVPVCQ